VSNEVKILIILPNWLGDAVMTTPATPHSRVTDHPVQFVFMTAHANGGGEGDSSDAPNEQIRAHVQAYDRILFDFSDIENYDPDNNYYLNKRLDDALYYDSTLPYDSGSRDANWASEFLTLHDDGELDRLTTGNNVSGYSGVSSCAHSPEGGETSDARLNCVLKGRASWYLFARLVGWNGGDADTTAPIISEITPVPSPTNDSTPDYTFNTDENGTITYGGSCDSTTTNATTGDNTITLNTLTDGTYSNCTIQIDDAAGNTSNLLDISEFTIDTTPASNPSSAPDLIASSDTGSSDTDNITMEENPVVEVECINGERVRFYTGGVYQTYTDCSVDGLIQKTMLTLTEGSHDITYTYMDAASNETAHSPALTVVVDTTLPILAETTSISSPTNDNTPNYTFYSNELCIML
jgi:hypothetical protein